MGFEAQTGQVDGSEAEVAAAAGGLAIFVVHVAEHAGAAAHVGYFGVVVARFVVLQVVGRVQKTEVGEESQGGNLHGQLEKIVVGVLRIIVDAFLDLEDLHGEDGGFAVAEARLGGQQQVSGGHAAFGGNVGAVVDGTEGHLRAGAGVHGVEVVDEGFHGLVGAAVGIAQGLLCGVGVGLGQHFGLVRRSRGQAAAVVLNGAHAGAFAQPGLEGLHQLAGRFGVQPGGNAHIGAQGAAVFLAKGFDNAASHGKVEVGHALAAVHFVLVGLDGDAGQG